MKIDYLFACDFHGYSWTEHKGIIYNITGGGGAELVETKPPQFHHALVFEVGKDYVAKQIIVVPDGFSIGDNLSNFTFIHIAPLYRDYSSLIIGMDAVLLILLILLFIPHARRETESISSEEIK